MLILDRKEDRKCGAKNINDKTCFLRKWKFPVSKALPPYFLLDPLEFEPKMRHRNFCSYRKSLKHFTVRNMFYYVKSKLVTITFNTITFMRVVNEIKNISHSNATIKQYVHVSLVMSDLFLMKLHSKRYKNVQCTVPYFVPKHLVSHFRFLCLKL